MFAIKYRMSILYKIRYINQHTTMIKAALKNCSKSCAT